MSVVVAIKENKKIDIGADSQVTRGGTRRTLRNPNNYKVWKIKGEKISQQKKKSKTISLLEKRIEDNKVKSK